jgi:hypothetical protein
VVSPTGWLDRRAGVLGVRLFVPAAIAEHLGIARSSVYRMLAMPHERQFPLAMSVHTTTRSGTSPQATALRELLYKQSAADADAGG